MVLDRLQRRYTVLRELGSGGTGRVVLARDRYLERDLALKILHERPGDDEDLEHLREEFALLAKIEHPGIARAFDFGLVDGIPYFTSEFIRGETLDVTALPTPSSVIPTREFLRRARLLVEALAFLHRSNIVHLDVKPGNILVAPDGCPVLIDFGLFRRGLPARAEGILRGSLPYMAPEYFRGEPIGPWTDVYAAGVTLYQAATGSFPRPGAASGADRATDPSCWLAAPRPPSHLEPSLPREFDHVLLKCLSLDHRRRFASAGEILHVFRRTESEAITVTAPQVSAAKTVGRRSELAFVDAFLERLFGREEGASRDRDTSAPVTLLVTGPRGMGQTHLLREVKIRAQTRGIPCYLEAGYPGRLPAPGSLLRPLGPHLGDDARERWEGFLERLGRPRPTERGEVTHEERRLRWRSEIALATAALRDPLIIAVDGLQLFDEVSVLLLMDLARVLEDHRSEMAPTFGLIIGCRQEGPLGHLIREFADRLLESGTARFLTCRALDPAECHELYRAAGGQEREGTGGLALFQDTGGCPEGIVALAHSEARGETGSADRERKTIGVTLPESETPERQLLVTLVLLDRPATGSELARLCGLPSRAVDRLLDRLHERRLVVEEQLDSVDRGWLGAPGTRALVMRCSRTERRRAHRRLAAALTEAAAEGDALSLLEAVEHHESGGNQGAFIRHGLRAAENLKATFQNRTALGLFERILEVLPKRRRNQRLHVTLTVAELQARIGEVERGIDLLKRQLRDVKEIPDSSRVKLLLQLATLHSRNGDFEMADSLFRRGFDDARSTQARLTKEEQLLFLNEHAAMKVFVGDFEGALALCERGFTLAGRGRKSRAVQEVILNLYATRANVALRRFCFEDAARDFLHSLQMAESVGSTVNEAVVLNNLGIVYSQSDRYGDAVSVFSKAERTCLELDEGPSLTFIYGNLAMLHAKTGDFAAMEEALNKASAIAAPLRSTSAASPGRRQRLFLEHHRGLALLSRGRYAEARPRLEEAIRLGRAVGDRLVVSFDEVYRAECLLFEGVYGDAREELLRLTADNVSAVLRRLALARLSLLEALTGDAGEVDRLSLEYHELGVKLERNIPFLEAWNGLFLGWALSVAGIHEQARDILATSEDYFRMHNLRPGASLAAWVRAESSFLEGRSSEALDGLESGSGPGSDLTAVLWPLLEARCRLEADPVDDRSCADRLAEAGASLVGNPLPEWTIRLDALRAVLLGAEDSAAAVEERRAELGSRLPEPQRRRYLESAYWKAWSSVRTDAMGVGDADAREAVAGTSAMATGTVPLESRESASMCRGLVIRSPAMRRLAEQLDRIRKSRLPVLIYGETGSGKELVAKAIHLESERSKAPFLVVDCATMPESLLELELFGARKGAFTGLDEDRSGLLRGADGGSLLFDEIGGAPLGIQAKLLRLLASGEFRSLGTDEAESVDVRFMFSTSRDLEEEVRARAFREDLLHRIRVLMIRVPPLRERREDLSTLARLFAEECGEAPPEFEPGFLGRLALWPWPGNVRELRNLMQRLRLEHTKRIPAAAADLDKATGLSVRTASSRTPSSQELRASQGLDPAFPIDLLADESLTDLKEKLERDYILFHLDRLRGDTQALSRLLGVSRKQFYRRCRALGIRLRKPGKPPSAKAAARKSARRRPESG